MTLFASPKGSAVNAGSELSLTTTSASLAGQELFFILVKDDDTPTTSRPLGLELLYEGDGGTAQIYLEVYYKILTADEPIQTYLWSGDSETYSVMAFVVKDSYSILDINMIPQWIGTLNGVDAFPISPKPAGKSNGLQISGFACDQEETPYAPDGRFNNSIYELVATGAGGHGNAAYFIDIPDGEIVRYDANGLFDIPATYDRFGTSISLSLDGLALIVTDGVILAQNAPIISFSRVSINDKWIEDSVLTAQNWRFINPAISGDGLTLVGQTRTDATTSGNYLENYYRATISSNWSLQSVLTTADAIANYSISDNGLEMLVRASLSGSYIYRTFTRASNTADWTQLGSDIATTVNAEDRCVLSGDALSFVTATAGYYRATISTAVWTKIPTAMTVPNADMPANALASDGLSYVLAIDNNTDFQIYSRTSNTSAIWNLVETITTINSHGSETRVSANSDFTLLYTSYYFDGVYCNERSSGGFAANHGLASSNDWIGYTIWLQEPTVFSHVGAGGFVLNGAALTTTVRSVTGNGGIVSGGDALFSFLHDYAASGGALFSGITDTALITGEVNVYEVFPVGGIALSGIAGLNLNWNFLPSGGASLSGNVEPTVLWNFSPSGGVNLSGSSKTNPGTPYVTLIEDAKHGNLILHPDGSFEYLYSGSGSEFYLSGAEPSNAIALDTFKYSITDEFNTSEPADNTIWILSTIKTFTAVGAGGINIGGAADVVTTILNSYSSVGSGSVFVYGATFTSPVRHCDGSGGILVNGSVYEPKFIHAPPVSGGISISGAAEVIKNKDWYANGAGSVYLDGNALTDYVGAPVDTYSYSGIGGAVFSGAAVTVKLNNNIVTPIGGILVSGSAVESFGYGVSPSGGGFLSGEADTSYIAGPVNTFSHTGVGSVDLSGDALISRIYSVFGSSGVITDGSALLSRSIDVAGSGEISVTGSGHPEKLDSRYPMNYIEFDVVINRNREFEVGINREITKDAVICSNKNNDAIISRNIDSEVQVTRVIDDETKHYDTIEFDLVIKRAIDYEKAISRRFDSQKILTRNKDLSLEINQDVDKEISIKRSIDYEAVM